VPSYREWGEILNVMEPPNRWGTINYNDGQEWHTHQGAVAGNRGRAKCTVADNGTTGDTYVTDSQANWYYHSGSEGTDDYGFRMLPAGIRMGNDDGSATFMGRGDMAWLWSSSCYEESFAHSLMLMSEGDELYNNAPIERDLGLSVRCTWDFPSTSTTTPPYAASTNTWVYGNLTASEVIQMPHCNKTSYSTEYYGVPDCRNYTAGSTTYYYYNWDYVKANEYLLCPSPWRVPTRADFNYIIGNGWRWLQDWPYTGYAWGDEASTNGGAGGETIWGVAWSSQTTTDLYDAQMAAYVLQWDQVPPPVGLEDRRLGASVRCVK
jgi:uncharacterized protein (TIGR02145 family)